MNPYTSYMTRSGKRFKTEPKSQEMIFLRKSVAAASILRSFQILCKTNTAACKAYKQMAMFLFVVLLVCGDCFLNTVLKFFSSLPLA